LSFDTEVAGRTLARGGGAARLPRDEERLRAIVEHLRDGVLALAPREDRGFFNAAWLRLFGVDRPYATVEDAFAAYALIDGEGRELRPEERPLSRVLRGETVRDLRVRVLVHANGRTRDVVFDGEPIRSEDGGVELALLTVRDVTDELATQGELAVVRERLKMALEGTRAWAWDWDLRSGDMWSSPGWEAMLGHDTGRLPSRVDALERLVHPDDRDGVLEALRAHLAGRTDAYESEHRLLHKDGGWVWVLDRGRVTERDLTGRAIRMAGIRTDIGARKQTELRLQDSEARLRLALETTGMGVWDWEWRGRSSSWSPELYRLLGIPRDTLPSFRAFLRAVHPEDRARTESEIDRVRRGRRERIEADFRISHPTAGERWISAVGRLLGDDGRSPRFLCTFQDVTERKLAEARIRDLAERDPLTGLPNRAHFQSELQRALGGGAGVGLILLDLDNFKQVNDTLGHDAGDLLLQIVARRLRDALRSEDTLGRLGGDEFAILLRPPLDERSVAEVAERIVEALREPWTYARRMLDTRGSLGIALAPQHDTTPAGLLKCADIALYTAKSVGRGGYVLYAPAMRSLMQQQVRSTDTARQALAEDGLIPHYQPKVELRTGQLRGFEALLRVRQSAGRLQSPSAISAAFEDGDLAVAISDRILDKAVSDMGRWLAGGVDFGSIAVNAGAPELRRADFADRVLDRLEAAGVPAAMLEIEVNETVFFGRGSERIEQTIGELSRAGVRIALDDFGTGFASLSHLRRLPVDAVKLDRSFVRKLGRQGGDEAIVRAVVALGASLDIEVVAEGVESEEQSALLRKIGCAVGQGFHLGKPVPAAGVPEIVRAHAEASRKVVVIGREGAMK